MPCTGETEAGPEGTSELPIGESGFIAPTTPAILPLLSHLPSVGPWGVPRVQLTKEELSGAQFYR